MATFCNLPPEILHVIIQACSPCKKDLVNLACVCKVLRSLAEPYLYREINWSWLETDTFDDLPIHTLLKSVLVRSEVASFVHHVSFRGWHDRRIWNLGNSPQAEESKPLQKLIQAANFPDQPRWMMGIRMKKVDVWAALLISQLPNLRSLELVFTDRSNANYISTMLGCAMTASTCPSLLSGFQHLRRVSYRTQQYPLTDPPLVIDINLGLILPLFYIPGIQTIEMSNVHSIPPNSFAWVAEAPRALKLATLVIESSRVDEETLERLLFVCPSLKTLKYEFILDARSERDTVDLVGKRLYRALSHVRNTLQCLEISIKFMRKHRYGAVSHLLQALCGPFGDLRDFTALTHLEIPLPLLLGLLPSSAPAWKDVLPDNLRSLTLTCGTDEWESLDRWDDQSCVRNVMENLRDTTAQSAQLLHLKIKLDWWIRRGDAEPGDFREADSRGIWEVAENFLGRRAGVRCEVEVRERYKAEGYPGPEVPALRKLGTFKL